MDSEFECKVIKKERDSVPDPEVKLEPQVSLQLSTYTIHIHIKKNMFFISSLTY